MDKYGQVIRKVILFAVICCLSVVVFCLFRESFEVKKLNDCGKICVLIYVLVDVIINILAVLFLCDILPKCISEKIYDGKISNSNYNYHNQEMKKFFFQKVLTHRIESHHS